MAQKILDGDQVRIGLEQLGGHRMTQLMAGYRRGISPGMAIRLSTAFGGSAESWITQQAQYDLWQAMQGAERIKRQIRAFA